MFPILRKFPHFQQLESNDCGSTCIRIIAKYYGRKLSRNELFQLSEITRVGTNFYKLSTAAEDIGFKSLGVRVSFNQLKNEVPLPCISHWLGKHFVVIYKVKRDKVFISDPAHGLIKYSKEEFFKYWGANNIKTKENNGFLLLLEPTHHFFKKEDEDKKIKRYSLFIPYIKKYKFLLFQVFLGLILESILSIIPPFLTQELVDTGVGNKDLSFVYLILGAQLFIFIGKNFIEILRNWILLYLSTRIHITLLTNFFIKLFKLPISFFDSKITGDILQRIQDNNRIQNLITSTSLRIVFSTSNLILFSIILLYYNTNIFLIFLIGSIIYLSWISLFLKMRKDLDYKAFSKISEEQSKVIELIDGMQEIKLHNAETQKRWGWEHIQSKLFKIIINKHIVEQFQVVGSSFINEFKNILIAILSAFYVIKGEMTLGMMLSISYIIGQLNSPLSQLIGFVHLIQDAKISTDRLNDIYEKKDEEDKNRGTFVTLPKVDPIIIRDLNFIYPGEISPTLKQISLTIPVNKTTAIVGSSGSGKTTLLKILLKFYDITGGEIQIGAYNLKDISQKSWREYCGVVMQEGFIFSGTIIENIAVGETEIDWEKLMNSLEIANIKDHIDSLPLRYKTKIGKEGLNLSTGQKQRILIARAVYKNPKYIFFDEATSALDANNEKTIVNNLSKFFKDRTAVIIAHRLSTVKEADQIIVLENGKIVEVGNHESLILRKRYYYELIKNQIEKIDSLRDEG